MHERGTMAYSDPMTNASVTKDKPSAGDPIPPKCSIIEGHVGELKQFNAIDPSPFRDKDLRLKAEELIVGWAKDLPRDATLALLVDLRRQAGLPDEAAVLRDAIHEFFGHRAETYRRLRELFRIGRTSLPNHASPRATDYNFTGARGHFATKKAGGKSSHVCAQTVFFHHAGRDCCLHWGGKAEGSG